jgi:hypothetical protein
MPGPDPGIFWFLARHIAVFRTTATAQTSRQEFTAKFQKGQATPGNGGSAMGHRSENGSFRELWRW